MSRRLADRNGNLYAREGVDRCPCGSKYWEFDECVSCGEVFRPADKVPAQTS